MVNIDGFGDAILAAGALGTAAFGIVEALKWTALGTAGFGKLKEQLAPLWPALQGAYGDNAAEFLLAQYRSNGSDLSRTLRQGIRVGMGALDCNVVPKAIAGVNPDVMRSVATSLAVAEPRLSPEQRMALGRFELAVDARVEAALSLAHERYVGIVRTAASLVAIALGCLGALLLEAPVQHGALMGLVAVPLAPIANDVVGALQAARRAVEGGRRALAGRA